eukprot:COSAG02_NODE_29637_length_565_cov_2.727468_1_plen_52_part_10
MSHPSPGPGQEFTRFCQSALCEVPGTTLVVHEYMYAAAGGGPGSLGARAGAR